jgi:peptidoglycan biosynthesis protein MviN/MurJ (putative lipid II flippase)
MSMIINLALSIALVWRFEIRGLAAALSVAAIIEFVLLARNLGRRLGGLGGSVTTYSVMRTLAASLLMAEVLLLWLAFLRLAGLLDLDNKIDASIAVLGGFMIGAAVYFYASRALRSQEAEVLVDRLPIPARVRSGLRL